METKYYSNKKVKCKNEIHILREQKDNAWEQNAVHGNETSICIAISPPGSVVSGAIPEKIQMILPYLTSKRKLNFWIFKGRSAIITCIKQPLFGFLGRACYTQV